MSSPKPFQDATVEAVLTAFADSQGRRRFLVADEVGLGKTVVAREVTRRMLAESRKPFIVYYIANGHAVSYQNKGRIVDFLDEEKRKAATATPDRLSLITVSGVPNSSILVYSLTPATSFPGASTRLTGGRKEERAFLKILLDEVYPALAESLGPEALRLSARGSWDPALANAQTRLDRSPKRIFQKFREALAIEFSISPSEINRRPVLGAAGIAMKGLKPTVLVGRLRRALALATLKNYPPSLIIFDEFQRYRQVLDLKEGDPLLKALLEPDFSSGPPAVLLLSATPYRHLATRWDEARGALAHTELLNLIEFLAGSGVCARARGLFSEFGNKLRDIAAHDGLDTHKLKSDADIAARLRDELRRLLTPFMSRTERDSVASTDSLAGTNFLPTTPSLEDFRIYRHLADGFAENMRYEALPYWSSVPLPAQSLGPRYAAWRHAKFKPASGIIQMTRKRRDGFNLPEWPDAKLRALGSIAPPKLLSLPWVAPSLPWWKLGGGWQDATSNPKLLMFSRFRATPPSIAALISFGVEAQCLRGKHDGYEKAYGRRRMKLAATAGPVMAAFHPSAWLIKWTDPLAGAGQTLRDVRKRVKQQILASLPGITIAKSTAKARRRHRPIAGIIASIERLANISDQSAKAWKEAIGSDQAAGAAIEQWRQAPLIDSLSPAELSELVDYAICAPGVVLGRALRRHDPTILEAHRLAELVRLSWHGLRAYLDNPVILSSLPGKNAIEQVMKAVVDGGLESVLDEHFWFRTQGLQADTAGLASELLASLRLRAGRFSFHGIGRKPHTIPVRCHVAVSFGDAEAEPPGKSSDGTVHTAPARPDEVRQSFNTPFWPHVLTTTSVGQEGLDFHPWCSQVVHWDFSSNPLDLEQREGRVQRFAGLAVRRRLGENLRQVVLSDTAITGTSPWIELHSRAESLVDASGLSPWWVLDGADIRRHVFKRPFGRDAIRFAQLREQRMIYRLALGQPNQEDFIEFLSRGSEATRSLLRSLILDLSAMGLRHKQTKKD